MKYELIEVIAPYNIGYRVLKNNVLSALFSDIQLFLENEDDYGYFNYELTTYVFTKEKDKMRTIVKFNHIDELPNLVPEFFL